MHHQAGRPHRIESPRPALGNALTNVAERITQLYEKRLPLFAVPERLIRRPLFDQIGSLAGQQIEKPQFTFRRTMIRLAPMR